MNLGPRALLPLDKTFRQLLVPYLGPYFIYVAVTSIPESYLPVDLGQLIKALIVGVFLAAFRKYYCPGRLKATHLTWALGMFPVALGLWIGPLYLLNTITGAGATDSADSFTMLYVGLRTFNAVILVALFEELFMRVYLMGWFYRAGIDKGPKSLVDATIDTLDHKPEPVFDLYISRFSVTATCIVFAAGHHANEYISAVFYYLFTTWVYRKTGSIWTCILIHGLTNLAISILVNVYGMAWLW